MVAARPLPQLAALCFFLTGTLGPWHQVGMQPAYADEAEAEGAAADAQDGEEGSGEPTVEQGQNFVDSAKELQEKLGQLKALLAKKGEDVDPQLQERLAGLEKQLEGLNLDGLAGSDGGASSELQEFLGGCIMMSMRRAGMKRPQTISALRQLASEKLTQEEGARLDLVRMISVCVQELTDQELNQFKSGKLQMLPPALAAKASEPGAKDVVLAIEANIWEQLGPVAGALQSQIFGDVDASRGLPSGTGFVAGIPLLLVFAFLGKKFYDMKQRESEEKDKKKKKKSNDKDK